MSGTREQVIAQCKVVAYLAKKLAEVHEDKSDIYVTVPMSDGLIEIVGRQTSGFMEKLGDMLNAMDAVDEEDAWTNPIFDAAHATWPSNP